MEAGNQNEGIHIPVVIGNHAPFRLVMRATDTWQPTLGQINTLTYDYVKLSRLSTFLDVGIAPFSLAIAFDGSLVLPAIDEYKEREKIVAKFNETLGILLLGGVYCEAVQPADISYGSLFIEGYLKVRGGSTGGTAHFHQTAKSKTVGRIEAIKLLEPKTILNTEIESAYDTGRQYFNNLKGFSPVLLLNGTSNYVRHQWIEGLIFTWAGIEQLINMIWTKNICGSSSQQHIEGRDSLLKDFRTWPISTKIEVLYQNEFISAEIYQLLNIARKARNDFVHYGKEISEEKVKSAIESLFRIISLVITDFQNDTHLNLAYDEVLKNQRGELLPKQNPLRENEVKYWMEIPALPGDLHWNKAEAYEIIPELVLQPLKGK
jgi:hypothetical protein